MLCKLSDPIQVIERAIMTLQNCLQLVIILWTFVISSMASYCIFITGRDSDMEKTYIEHLSHAGRHLCTFQGYYFNGQKVCLTPGNIPTVPNFCSSYRTKSRFPGVVWMSEFMSHSLTEWIFFSFCEQEIACCPLKYPLFWVLPWVRESPLLKIDLHTWDLFWLKRCSGDQMHFRSFPK